MNVPDDDDDPLYIPSENEGDGEDKEDEVLVVNDIEEASPSSTKKLESITYDDKVQLYTCPEGRQRWRCRWCNKNFHWNPSRKNWEK